MMFWGGGDRDDDYRWWRKCYFHGHRFNRDDSDHLCRRFYTLILSRNREYLADASAAGNSHEPYDLFLH